MSGFVAHAKLPCSLPTGLCAAQPVQAEGRDWEGEYWVWGGMRGFGVGGRQAGFHFAVMGMLQNGSSPSTCHSSSLLLAVLF